MHLLIRPSSPLPCRSRLHATATDPAPLRPTIVRALGQTMYPREGILPLDATEARAVEYVDAWLAALPQFEHAGATDVRDVRATMPVFGPSRFRTLRRADSRETARRRTCGRCRSAGLARSRSLRWRSAPPRCWSALGVKAGLIALVLLAGAGAVHGLAQLAANPGADRRRAGRAGAGRRDDRAADRCRHRRRAALGPPQQISVHDPAVARAASLRTRSISAARSAELARDQDFIGRAEISAPVDVDVALLHGLEGAFAVEHHRRYRRPAGLSPVAGRW